MTSSMLQGLLGTLVIIGSLLSLQLLNAPKQRRHQNYALPFIALVFALLSLVVLYAAKDLFEGVKNWLLGAAPVLEQLDQVQWNYVIANTNIVMLFFAVKLVYRIVSALLFDGEEFLGSTFVEKFYEYVDQEERWFVRDHLNQLRAFWRSLFWVSIALTAALVFAMAEVPAWQGFLAIVYPALATMVIGEFLYAIDGVTGDELKDRISGEDDSANRVANYVALREVFESEFADRVIDGGVDLANPYWSNTYLTLDELLSSESDIDQIYGDYFDRAKQAGESIEENLVHASLGIYGGASTLINTPFYNDLTHYLALPAYIRLLSGGKTLIVAGRDSAAEDLRTWFHQGLERITGAPGLWRAEVLRESAIDALDVGILSPADLHNMELLRANDEFFRDVELVILVEPSRLLATSQLGLGLVVSRLSRGEEPTYVGIDRNHDGLVDSLSHLLKVSITDVVATQQSLGSSSESVWSAEGPRLASQILPGISRYLGLGTEISATALKFHVSRVEWVGGDRFPVVDMSWIAGQYYGKITSFAEMDPSQREMATALQARPNPLALEQEKRRFLVVEDEFWNVYEALRLFASRSTETGFINLISENYLLRDYMVDNRELFSIDPKAIPSIVPDYARSKRNTVLRLLVLLTEFGVPESVLLRELELVGCVPVSNSYRAGSISPAVELLRGLIFEYLGIENLRFTRTTGMPHLKYARSAEGEFDKGNQVEDIYHLERDPDVESVLRRLRSAYFLAEDETEGRDYIGSCLQDHVAQTLLPGQFLTLNGKYYEVLAFGEGDHQAEVLLRRAAEHISGRPVYRPLRSFEISARHQAQGSVARTTEGGVTIDREIATVRVTSHGYLELPSRNRLDKSRQVFVGGLAPRTYHEKEVLRIGLPGATPEIRRTIALMLNELFITVFPHGHPFVSALAFDPEKEFGDLLGQVSVEPMQEEIEPSDEAIWIVEDSLVDLGMIIAIERNWRRFFEVVTDYLTWLHEPVPEKSTEVGHFAGFKDETPEQARAREERALKAEADAGKNVGRPESGEGSVWGRVVGKVKAWWAGLFGGKPDSAEPVDELEDEPGVGPEPELQPEQKPEPELEPEPEDVALAEDAVEPDPDPVAEPESNHSLDFGLSDGLEIELGINDVTDDQTDATDEAFNEREESNEQK